MSVGMQGADTVAHDCPPPCLKDDMNKMVSLGPDMSLKGSWIRLAIARCPLRECISSTQQPASDLLVSGGWLIFNWYLADPQGCRG